MGRQALVARPTRGMHGREHGEERHRDQRHAEQGHDDCRRQAEIEVPRAPFEIDPVEPRIEYRDNRSRQE